MPRGVAARFMTTKAAPSKQAIMWIIAFAGFVSLGPRLACRDWRCIYVAAALLLPIIRYRFPVGGLLVFLAAEGPRPEARRPSVSDSWT
jgi:hypothetical protein